MFYTLFLQFYLKYEQKRKNFIITFWGKKIETQNIATIMKSLYAKRDSFSNEVEITREIISIKIFKKIVLKKI